MVGKLKRVLMPLVGLATLLTYGLALGEAVAPPPGEAGAKAALEKSTRHHEWAKIALAGSEVKLNAFVAYPEALTTIKAPVLGLYGEDDARVTTTIPPAAEKLKELGKVYITHIYQGAGHGFLRAQDDRNGANLEASKQAWPATVEFLRKNLE